MGWPADVEDGERARASLGELLAAAERGAAGDPEHG
jgi:hypothetical protein